MCAMEYMYAYEKAVQLIVEQIHQKKGKEECKYEKTI